MVKVCKNDKKKTYKGDENTPLGKGYHADGEKIDKKMKGKDGHMYKVIKTKNGKRWQKIKKEKKMSPKRTKKGAIEKEIVEGMFKIGSLKNVAYGNKEEKIPNIYSMGDFEPGDTIYFSPFKPKDKEIYCENKTKKINDDTATFKTDQIVEYPTLGNEYTLSRIDQSNEWAITRN